MDGSLPDIFLYFSPLSFMEDVESPWVIRNFYIRCVPALDVTNRAVNCDLRFQGLASPAETHEFDSTFILDIRVHGYPGVHEELDSRVHFLDSFQL